MFSINTPESLIEYVLGLEGEEGKFTMVTFWLIEAMSRVRSNVY